ncbi:MAG: 4-(cytidine 5'-diphospho)-2-C-methyl-D-erythritol kinase, partial [Thermotogaceae bacterium]|nr:4-(cytidine 5'-diphospho)-2-C-methyl-D-erythritol kinase [Thermotogaceae bacterium]
MVKNSAGWIEKASYAKLNLFLDVVGKREDGYHNIVSVFQEISLHDTMKVKFTKNGFKLESTKALPEDNTLYKAYEIFKEALKLDFGLHIKLIKRIPSGAGLGGGSSNAAALIRILSEYFRVDKEDVLKVAESVGSDVPFFLYGGTALVEGRGEFITPLDDLPEYGVILFVPRVRVSTKFAYQTLRKEDFGR